jgi:ABC-type glycerol-3-phosphate transport system substrate-binding protein
MNRRRLLQQSIAFAPALAGAACGAGGPSGPAAGLAEQAVTLRYLTWYGGDRRPTTDAWIAAFNEGWPRARVEVEELVLNDFPAKFQAQLAGGTPPDVVLADSHAQTKWFDSGAHLDLAPYLNRDRINLQRDYALVGIEQWCGKVYFVPFFADSNAWFYNKTMLQRAGLKDPWADGKGDWTLDDLYTMARRVTQDLDGDGVPDQWGIWLGWGISETAPWTWTRGGDVADLQKMQYTVDAPPSLEGHRQLYDWLLKDRIILPQAEQQRLTQASPGRDPFAAGKVAFRLRAVNDVTLYQRTVDGAFEWDCLLFPKLDDKHPGVGLAAGTGHSVVKDSKAPEQAYQLVRTISTDRGQEIMAQTLGLPALKAKQESWLKARTQGGGSPAHARVWQDVFTRPYGVHFRHHTTREVQDIYGTQLNAVRGGQAALAPALQEANRLMNGALRYGDCQPYKGLAHPIQPKR